MESMRQKSYQIDFDNKNNNKIFGFRKIHFNVNKNPFYSIEFNNDFNHFNFYESENHNIKEIIDLKRDILSSTKICAVANEIISIMASAQNQLQRALSKNDFAYSYLSLFQVLELISRDFITPDSGTRNAWLVNNDTPLYYYETDGHIPVRQGIILEEWPSIKRKITGIYVDVCGGADCRFLRENLFLDVDRRNAFVHNDNVELADPRIAKVFSADGFIHLLSTIRVLFNGIL